MIKGSTLQEDTTILNVHLPNNKATKYARDYGKDCIPGVIFSGKLEQRTTGTTVRSSSLHKFCH